MTQLPLRQKTRRPYVHRAWNDNWRVYLPSRTNPLASVIRESRTWHGALAHVAEYHREAACSLTN